MRSNEADIPPLHGRNIESDETERTKKKLRTIVKIFGFESSSWCEWRCASWAIKTPINSVNCKTQNTALSGRRRYQLFPSHTICVATSFVECARHQQQTLGDPFDGILTKDGRKSPHILSWFMFVVFALLRFIADAQTHTHMRPTERKRHILSKFIYITNHLLQS